MSGNLSLLTVLFIMCYFINNSRNVVLYTELTRDSNGDYFTNVCKNCYGYGAILNQSVCKCESSRSLFLRFEQYCVSESDFMRKEQCQQWKSEFVEVIDTEKKDSEYTFPRKIQETSCQLEPLISYRNSTVEVWQFFNLSGNNVLELHSDPHNSRSLIIKVTQVSPSLTKFKGYVMKLGLKCKIRASNETEESCLLFKAKGKIRFPLNCSVPVDATTVTSSTKASTLSTSLVTSPTTTIKPSIVTPSSCFALYIYYLLKTTDW